MNPQQQQQQGPSTPQRIFSQQQAINQGRPGQIVNQQYVNRSYSPHTPSQGAPPQQQLIRTPIQLMQQQTKQVSGGGNINKVN